ncbi:MAG: hypothetical protein UIM26_00830, partial [Longicatena sp.]|nr:hypothetical protein [Longicatena sp.]
WSKMEGVTHYQVYRATSSTGKYTKLVTTTETSYTSKSLTKGKKYFFKVRGYKTYKSGDDVKYTVYTPYSKVKYATAKSLTKGKKYYFKVRGYKTYKSGDNISYKVYTPYSSAKAIVGK